MLDEQLAFAYGSIAFHIRRRAAHHPSGVDRPLKHRNGAHKT